LVEWWLQCHSLPPRETSSVPPDPLAMDLRGRIEAGKRQGKRKKGREKGMGELPPELISGYCLGSIEIKQIKN